MEEYEVDLRDYFRVMWRKKWLILGVFLVAVTAALLFSFEMPNRYEVAPLVRLNDLPQIAKIQISAPSPQMVMVMAKARDLLTRTAEEARLAEEGPFRDLSPKQLVEWLRDNLKLSIPEKSSLIEVKLSGALEPWLLQRILTEHLRVLEARLQENVVDDVQREIARVFSETSVLEGQRAGFIQEIEEKVVERRAILEKQRESLRRQLSALEQDREKLGLLVGEQDATLEGIVQRERFIAWNTRLQQVERELEELELRRREQFPALNDWILVLEREIYGLQLAKENARELLNLGWKALSIVSPPTGPLMALVGPNRAMIVAVAAVLGLFAGVLLVFFVHYLESEQGSSVKQG